MRRKTRFTAICLAAAMALTAVSPAAVWADREEKTALSGSVAIKGAAQAGETLSVDLSGLSGVSAHDLNIRWEMVLPPAPASQPSAKASDETTEKPASNSNQSLVGRLMGSLFGGLAGNKEEEKNEADNGGTANGGDSSEAAQTAGNTVTEPVGEVVETTGLNEELRESGDQPAQGGDDASAGDEADGAKDEESGEGDVSSVETPAATQAPENTEDNAPQVSAPPVNNNNTNTNTGSARTTTVGKGETLVLTSEMVGRTIYAKAEAKLSSGYTGTVVSPSVVVAAAPQASAEEQDQEETKRTEQDQKDQEEQDAEKAERDAERQERKEERLAEREERKAKQESRRPSVRAAQEDAEDVGGDGVMLAAGPNSVTIDKSVTEVVVTPGQETRVSLKAAVTVDDSNYDPNYTISWTITAQGNGKVDARIEGAGTAAPTIRINTTHEQAIVPMEVRTTATFTEKQDNTKTESKTDTHTIKLIIKEKVVISDDVKTLPVAVAGEAWGAGEKKQDDVEIKLTSDHPKVQWSLASVKVPGSSTANSVDAQKILNDLGLQFDTSDHKFKPMDEKERKIARDINTGYGIYEIVIEARRVDDLGTSHTQGTDDFSTLALQLEVQNRRYSLTAIPNSIDQEIVVGANNWKEDIVIQNTGNVNLKLTDKLEVYRVETQKDENDKEVEVEVPDKDGIFKAKMDFGTEGNAYSLAPGGTFNLELSFNGAEKVGEYKARVKIGADDEQGDPKVATTWAHISAKINVREKYKSDISFSPSSISFGSVDYGYSTAPSPQQVVITNIGEDDLLLNQPVAPRGYTVSNLDPATIKAGEKAYFTVVPNGGLDVGLYNSSINITATDTSNQAVSSKAPLDVKFEVIGNKFTGTAPVPSVTGVENGVEKSAGGLGLPETVEIKTSQGSASAAVNWDVDSTTYKSEDVEAHSFDVDGTIRLPDGISNPDNLSLATQVRVSVDAYEPKIPAEEDLTISNVSEGGTYNTKTAISFTTNVLGNQQKPRKGDMRYVPKSWNMGTLGASFSNGSYSGVLNVAKEGSQVLTVLYDLQEYDGKSWVSTETTASKSLNLNFQKAPPEDEEGDNNSGGGKDGTGTPTPTPTGTPNASAGQSNLLGSNNGSGTSNGSGTNSNGSGTTTGSQNPTAGASGTATPVAMSTAKADSVKTADETEPGLWIAVLGMAAAGSAFAGASLRRRKKS